MFTSLMSISLGAILINNFIFSQFLGCCPFLGCSNKVDTAVGMGVAVTFVMGLASAICWVVNKYLLVNLGLEYMQTLTFILVIAVLVQFVEMFLKKSVPSLYTALGIYLPLITTNCAVLGVVLLNVQNSYNFIESVVYGITELSHSGIRYWPAYPALVVGAVLVRVFLRRQSGLAVPLVDVALFADRRFSAAIVAQLVIVFANVGALFFLPIFLRQVDGFSPLQSGAALLPESLMGLVTAVSVSRIIRTRGHRVVLLAGLSAGAAGLIALGLTLPVSYPAMVVPLMMLGFSFGAVTTCAADLVLTSAPADRVGAATGISETAFELGNALGIALTGSAVAVLYLLVGDGAAQFGESVDPPGFTASLAGSCVLGGVVLGVVTAVVARALRDRATTAETSPGQ